MDDKPNSNTPTNNIDKAPEFEQVLDNFVEPTQTTTDDLPAANTSVASESTIGTPITNEPSTDTPTASSPSTDTPASIPDTPTITPANTPDNSPEKEQLPDTFSKLTQAITTSSIPASAIASNDTTSQANFDPNKKTPFKKFAIIGMALATVVLMVGIVVAQLSHQSRNNASVTIADLTDEQKQKLGIAEKIPSKETSEQEANYSDEYKNYLNLSDEEKAKLEVIPRKDKIPDEKIDEIKDETDDKVLASLPDQFDLRDTINITIGDQGSFGLCWDYATGTALETHLKLRGIDYDPSEYQVDFLASNLTYGSRNLHSGGYFSAFIDVAASIGIISEDEYSLLNIDPRSEYTSYDGRVYTGSDGNYDYLSLAKNNNPIYVTKTVDFPSVYKTAGKANNKTDAELQEFRDLVKAHIMTNGALYTATTAPWPGLANRYCEKAGIGCQTNHAMAIIGWDDNYPKENFVKVNENSYPTEETPEHDGAYIVFNSWGNNWIGPNIEGAAFYVSYDEYDIESQLSGIVSTSIEDTRNLKTFKSPLAKGLVEDELSFYIFEKNGEEYISDYALSKLSYLDLSNRGLSDQDLRNLARDIAQNLPNVTSLDIGHNSITDLSFLKDLPNLSSIHFSNNQVADILPLCSAKNITDFQLSYNNIKDVSCLSSKFDENSYGHLDVSGNVSVSGIDKLTNLHSLIADEIGLESLAQLSNLTKLDYLSVARNHIKNLDGLNALELNTLNVSGNELTDLSTEATIGFLSIANNHLEDIAILNNITSTGVDASENSFDDLSQLNNAEILWLNLDKNKKPLSNFSSLSSLSTLSLRNCDIKSLAELGELKNLSSLTLSGNQLESLDGIEKLQNLTDLNVDNNNITSLAAISKLDNLLTLDASNNKISNADGLANLKNLYYASLRDNQLTAIPNFSTQETVYLDLANNPISSAIIPQSIASINLTGCNISSLDASKATLLTNLVLTDNPNYHEYPSLITALVNRRSPQKGQYCYVTTDRTFSSDELKQLGEITQSRDHVSLSLSGSEYDLELEKTPNGTVNLEAYPDERKFLMRTLRTSAKTNDYQVDKAATELHLANPTIDSLSFDWPPSQHITSNLTFLPQLRVYHLQ